MTSGHCRVWGMTHKQRVDLVPGFLLHQRPYRESSALLEIFTATHGRVGLVARGVRSARSKQRGDLQPFRQLQFSWLARRELGTLISVEPGDVTGFLQGETLYSAFYLNELLIRLVARDDPHPELFAVYSSSLQALVNGSDIEVVLRRFELQLLQQLGYGLQLECDSETGEALVMDALYDYHLESGPVKAEAGMPGGFLFRGASLVAMARGELNESEVLQDSKRLMRAALRLYLGDKPLKSRELFRKKKPQG